MPNIISSNPAFNCVDSEKKKQLLSEIVVKSYLLLQNMIVKLNVKANTQGVWDPDGNQQTVTKFLILTHLSCTYQILLLQHQWIGSFLFMIDHN